MIEQDAIAHTFLRPDAQQLVPVCVACGLVEAEGFDLPPSVWADLPDVGQWVSLNTKPILCLPCRERAWNYCASWDPDVDAERMNVSLDHVLRWLRMIGAYDRRRTP